MDLPCARAQLQRPRASAEQIVMHVAVQQEVARVRERARAHGELEQAAWTLHGLYEELWAARDGLHETISFQAECPKPRRSHTLSLFLFILVTCDFF